MENKTLLKIFGTVGAVGTAYWLMMRPWHLGWGATPEEVHATLPGDDLVPEPTEQATHAITIHAPASAVWPWLVQIGQDKGGFYSYTWLENLVGCQMHNADHLVPEFQHIQVGDEVWLHPDAPPLPVLIVEPERTLVLGNNTGAPGVWGFHLKALDENTTRLIARGRGGGSGGWWSQIGHYALLEPAHFIMERKMLLHIKHLAEKMSLPQHAAA